MMVAVVGKSGVVVYGELTPSDKLYLGKFVKQGDLIGSIKRVLKKDKGRPMSMLHLELYEHGSEICHPWQPNGPKPKGLLDPTPYLMEANNGVQGTVPNVLK